MAALVKLFVKIIKIFCYEEVIVQVTSKKQKILLLGGSFGQIPKIKEAKRRGLYTILCDYLPDNPGKELVDKFYLASTTDKAKVLEIARENDIDFVLAYCSDPAVPTSAYVSKKLGLIGNSPESIKLLTHKNLFRNFQKKNRFKSPDYIVLKDSVDTQLERANSLFPAVVKPVDSSDTKGITLVEKMSELQTAVQHAFQFTTCGRVIIEEKVDSKIANLHGDGFVIDGELEFCELGDYLFTSAVNPLKPSSTIFPSRLDQQKLQQVETEVAQIIKKSGYEFGPVNIEARINAENEIYVMEIGPRSGGSYTPQAIQHSTGFDMLGALFDVILNEEISIPEQNQKPTINFTIHFNKEGIFDSFEIDEDLKPFVAEKHIFVQPGDRIKSYDKPGSSLGGVIFTFKNLKEADKHAKSLYQKVVGGINLYSNK